MPARAYVVIATGDQRVQSPIEQFPSRCPNCGTPWHVSEEWLTNGEYQTGGLQALCPDCDCCMFQVIDVDRQAFEAVASRSSAPYA